MFFFFVALRGAWADFLRLVHTVKHMQADFLIQTRLFSLMDGFTMEQGSIKTKTHGRGRGCLWRWSALQGFSFLPWLFIWLLLFRGSPWRLESSR